MSTCRGEACCELLSLYAFTLTSTFTLTYCVVVYCVRVSGRCGDYVQLYVDLERPEVAERAVPSFSLCGNRSSLAQTKFYSSQRSLIIEFHADTRHDNNTGFHGIYRFLDKGHHASYLLYLLASRKRNDAYITSHHITERKRKRASKGLYID